MLVKALASVLVILAIGGGMIGIEASPKARVLLNVSYDPTRELYQKINAAFVKHWQVRAVIDGLDVDLVTLALGYDVDAIAQAGLIKPDWQPRLADRGAPFTSTIVF